MDPTALKCAGCDSQKKKKKFSFFFVVLGQKDGQSMFYLTRLCLPFFSRGKVIACLPKTPSFSGGGSKISIWDYTMVPSDWSKGEMSFAFCAALPILERVIYHTTAINDLRGSFVSRKIHVSGNIFFFSENNCLCRLQK